MQCIRQSALYCHIRVRVTAIFSRFADAASIGTQSSGDIGSLHQPLSRGQRSLEHTLVVCSREESDVVLRAQAAKPSPPGTYPQVPTDTDSAYMHHRELIPLEHRLTGALETYPPIQKHGERQLAHADESPDAAADEQLPPANDTEIRLPTFQEVEQNKATR